MKVKLTKAQLEELEQLKNLPIPKSIQGYCRNCSRAIPFGYVPFVTKWEGQRQDGFSRQVPVEIWCRDCSDQIDVPKEHRKRRRVIITPPPQEDRKAQIKRIATLLLAATSLDVPHGSKFLAITAGLEYGPLIRPILFALKDAGKVTYSEGKWLRVRQKST